MKEARFTPGPWRLRERKDQPTADVLRNLSDEEWGLVIWVPCPPFALGAVGAVVCTADRDRDATLSIANQMVAAPDLFAFVNALDLAADEHEMPAWFWDLMLTKGRPALAKARGEA